MFYYYKIGTVIFRVNNDSLLRRIIAQVLLERDDVNHATVL